MSILMNAGLVLSDMLQIRTGCRFVHLEFQMYFIQSLCQLKRNELHEQLNKQTCQSFSVHVPAWLVYCSRCRRLFSTTNAEVFPAWLFNFEATQ